MHKLKWDPQSAQVTPDTIQHRPLAARPYPALQIDSSQLQCAAGHVPGAIKSPQALLHSAGAVLNKGAPHWPQLKSSDIGYHMVWFCGPEFQFFSIMFERECARRLIWLGHLEQDTPPRLQVPCLKSLSFSHMLNGNPKDSIMCSLQKARTYCFYAIHSNNDNDNCVWGDLPILLGTEKHPISQLSQQDILTA